MQITLDGFMSGPNGGLECLGQYHDDAIRKDVFAVLVWAPASAGAVRAEATHTK